MIKNFHTLKYATIALMAMVALTFAFSSCQKSGPSAQKESEADTQDMSSHEVIEKLKSAVEAHRAGAEPNDDLTLMCITLK